MKKIYYIALFLLLSLGSCKKYLETQPTDFLDPVTYYETEAQLKFARAGVYHILGSNGLYGNYATYLYGWQGDEGLYNRAATTGPHLYTYSTADVYNNALWTTLFDGINRANVLLANLDKNAKISQGVRDVIRGEMHFLRGYFYFILAQNYGGVPLKLEPTTSIVDVDIARATLKETYDQILKDMEAAEPLVPGIVSLGYAGAVSKSAVRGMLARVNLHMAGEPLKDNTEHRYREVMKWASAVINDPEAGHALNPKYEDIFINMAADKYDIKESIWEVEFWGNEKDGIYIEAGNNGSVNGIPSAETSINGLNSAYLNVTSKLYNAYEPGDKRLGWNIAHFTYPAVIPPLTSPQRIVTASATLPTTDAAKTFMKPGKWRREFEVVPKNGTNTPINVPLMRLADIMLMYAEAENEVTDDRTIGIGYVNQIRERSWSTGVKEIRVVTQGSGYSTTTRPTINVTPRIGGATAPEPTTVLSGGRITRIDLARDPSGVSVRVEGDYSTPPTVTIDGRGFGSGATATVILHKKEDAILKPAQTDDKGIFRELIKNERLRELNFEGLRKADLIRWGDFLTVMQDIGNRLSLEAPAFPYYAQPFKNVERKHLLMPIPASEMSTNQLMVQNPGW